MLVPSFSHKNNAKNGTPVGLLSVRESDFETLRKFKYEFFSTRFLSSRMPIQVIIFENYKLK